MKSPKAPDPQDMARAQSASSQSSAMMQSLLNQYDQSTPYGKSIYSQIGTNSYFDPALGRKVTVPKFQLSTELSPNQQGLLAQEEEFDKLYNTIGLQQTRNIGEHLQQPFSYDTGEYENWANNLYNKIAAPEDERNRAAQANRLANQGLSAGSTAYNDAMKSLYSGQDQARNQFMLGARGQGMQEALTLRNQPINEIAALMGGGQVQQPQFQSTPQVAIPTFDAAGAMMNQYNQANQNYQSNLGAIAGLGGAIGGGWAQSGGLTKLLSDRRAKKYVHKVGETPGGDNIYSFKYKNAFGGGLTQLGVMAQEVRRSNPEAVSERPDGMLEVDYAQLGQGEAA